VPFSSKLAEPVARRAVPCRSARSIDEQLSVSDPEESLPQLRCADSLAFEGQLRNRILRGSGGAQGGELHFGLEAIFPVRPRGYRPGLRDRCS